METQKDVCVLDSLVCLKFVFINHTQIFITGIIYICKCFSFSICVLWLSYSGRGREPGGAGGGLEPPHFLIRGG